MGIEGAKPVIESTPRSPMANAICERLIGTMVMTRTEDRI